MRAYTQRKGKLSQSFANTNNKSFCGSASLKHTAPILQLMPVQMFYQMKTRSKSYGGRTETVEDEENKQENGNWPNIEQNSIQQILED